MTKSVLAVLLMFALTTQAQGNPLIASSSNVFLVKAAMIEGEPVIQFTQTNSPCSPAFIPTGPLSFKLTDEILCRSKTVTYLKKLVDQKVAAHSVIEFQFQYLDSNKEIRPMSFQVPLSGLPSKLELYYVSPIEN